MPFFSHPPTSVPTAEDFAGSAAVATLEAQQSVLGGSGPTGLTPGSAAPLHSTILGGSANTITGGPANFVGSLNTSHTYLDLGSATRSAGYTSFYDSGPQLRTHHIHTGESEESMTAVLTELRDAGYTRSSRLYICTNAFNKKTHRHEYVVEVHSDHTYTVNETRVPRLQSPPDPQLWVSELHEILPNSL